MKTFFRQIFSGKDNNTPDIARLLWASSFVFYVGLTFYAIYKGTGYTFDPLLWASGIAAMAGGYGASIYAKAGTEPSEAFMVKTDKVMFKQSTGKAARMGGDDSDDSSSSDTPDSADTPDTSDQSDTDTTKSVSSTTVSKMPRN